MRYALALVCVCVLALTPFALADGGNPTAVPAAEPCTPLKQVYSPKRWRERHPARGENPCPSSNTRKLRSFFRLYREYRLLAPYRCHSGREGYYAIPCYIIACESGFSWRAANQSGAIGAYQLLGWTDVWPVRNFRDRMVHHRIAASLGLSHWVCA